MIESRRVDWCSQGLFDSPFSPNAHQECLPFNTCEDSPFAQGAGSSIPFVSYILPGVPCLFLHGGPANIARFIVALIVYTVKGISLFAVMRKPRHMRVKGFKRVLPFRAYSYTPSTIAMIRLVVRIVAACKHSFPQVVYTSVRHSVLPHNLADLLFLEAATRFRMARAQILAYGAYFRAAIAKAEPNNSSAFPSDRAKRDESAESLARNIFCTFGEGDILGLHRNLSFRCHAQDVCRVAGHFSLGCYSCIVAQKGCFGI